MTFEELRRCEGELLPLVAREGASASAREDAGAFNAELEDVRGALLEPARRLQERGELGGDLSDCLARSVAELEFWRRVLLRMHPGAFASGPASSEHLLRYVLS